MMPEISQQVLWNSMQLPAIGQTSHFRTLQTEHDIVADIPSRHSMADFTPFVDLNGNHIPRGSQCPAVNPAYDQGVLELALHNRGDLPLSIGNKDKRKRNSNWTDEETSILVRCKKAATVDNGSRFCKGKGDVTNWDSIAEEINNNLGTISISKTGDQCRLRWDTLVKSYQKVKEYCLKNGRQYSDLTRRERVELKLATTLSKDDWFEVIDQYCRPKSRKSKSQKLDIVASRVDAPLRSLHDSRHFNSTTQIGTGSFEARESSSMGAGAMQDIAGLDTPRSDLNSVALDPPVQAETISFEFQESFSKELEVTGVMPGWNDMNGELYPADCGVPLPTQSPASEPRKSSTKQVAIPGFTSMSQDLKFTILNLVQAWPAIPQYSKIGKICRWLAIVQDQSPSKTRSYVFSLLHHESLAILDCLNEECKIRFKSLRVYKKFCKVVISKNVDFNVHNRVLRDNNMLSFELSSVLLRIRVLTLFRCAKLERVDLEKLPMLRCLTIQQCSNLKEMRGWENLSRLGWLEITGCVHLHGGHLRVHCLPSLKEVCIEACGSFKSDGLEEYKLDFSQCVRLRKVKIYGSLRMKSVDLSTLKCLEVVDFYNCPALESIVGLSEAHSLMKFTLSFCTAMERVPYLGHLKALAKLKLCYSGAWTNTGFENLHLLIHLTLAYWRSFETALPDLSGLKELTYLAICIPGVEEIRGLDKLHSLTVLNLDGCEALKRLPYLGDLKALKDLDISDCGVDEIPGVRELVNLEILSCNSSELEWLPDLRHLPHLQSVWLYDTPLERAPSSKYFEKPRGLPRVESKEGGKSAEEEEEEDVSDADYVPSDQEAYDEEYDSAESDD